METVAISDSYIDGPSPMSMSEHYFESKPGASSGGPRACAVRQQRHASRRRRRALAREEALEQHPRRIGSNVLQVAPLAPVVQHLGGGDGGNLVALGAAAQARLLPRSSLRRWRATIACSRSPNDSRSSCATKNGPTIRCTPVSRFVWYRRPLSPGCDRRAPAARSSERSCGGLVAQFVPAAESAAAPPGRRGYRGEIDRRTLGFSLSPPGGRGRTPKAGG